MNALTLAAIIAAVGVMWRALLSGRRVARAANQFLDDWTGQAARPGHRARPGIPERLERLETGQDDIREQLKVRSGDTLGHAVDRIPPNDDPKGTT